MKERERVDVKDSISMVLGGLKNHPFNEGVISCAVSQGVLGSTEKLFRASESDIVGDISKNNDIYFY
ncbi:hypothetical protein Lalb_Chr17g0337451 [Lupinus albus]|uniref:Uncharacterized protein n=1 Tax=Lupinus albus TaxID=3870 RepID=A0A6A4NNK6_LUPAL|nr:hypothetical protein Lalb_Chr17g0337451 [Lupinus albus]